jgi:hypothetical protein
VTHTDDVDPTEWADQIIHSTEPSRTLRGADAAASGRAALEAAGVDLSALEQRIAKGGRPGLDDYVTGVEEDRAIAPMVVERLTAGGGRPFNELLHELGMSDSATSTEPHPLD